MVVSKCMMKKKRSAAVRGQGWAGGAFAPALNFWPHLFFQEKRWENNNVHDGLKKFLNYHSQMLRSSA